ncbi:MAG: GNAT family N-acetyltransferase [Myxococcales bacterium]|nr:GNAT family N-acetyltransferase [Myxococcales bacterium]
MTPDWEITPIGRHHERSLFDCGVPALNVFLRRYARQNQEHDAGRTWVATRRGELRVLGFYTLAASSVAFDHLPEAERRGLPRYPVPVAHLGRLGVDLAARGLGLGGTLLMHALDQCDRASKLLAIRAVEVRAKSDDARRFYKRYGFVGLLDDQNHLYLSIKVVRRLFFPQE